jgi:hypothetical protein
MAKTYDAFITTTGSAGSATGTAYIDGACGLVTRIQGNWHGSAPGATSDVTIIETDSFGSQTLYTKSNSVTDFDFAPMKNAADNTNTALDPVAMTPYTVSGGRITISVTGCDALTDALSVKITVLE